MQTVSSSPETEKTRVASKQRGQVVELVEVLVEVVEEVVVEVNSDSRCQEK